MEEQPINRLYAALAAGDMAAARACFTPDARIWHNFDGIALTLDEAAQGWAGLIAQTAARHIEDARCHAIEGGFVQQHVFVLRTASGERRAWPLCVLVETRQGLICRFNEYIDRAGSFAPPEGPVRMPGF